MEAKKRRRWLRRLVAYGSIISLVAIAIAVALPNFWRTAAPPRHGECVANLNNAYLAQSSFYEEHGSYSPFVQELRFYPERSNRYAYFLDEEGPLIDRGGADESLVSEATGFAVDVLRWGEKSAVGRSDLPETFAGPTALGLSGTCPDCSITMACGAIGHDGRTLDVWSISTEDRLAEDGTVIPKGRPHRER